MIMHHQLLEPAQVSKLVLITQASVSTVSKHYRS